MTSTKTAADLNAGDSIINPDGGNTAHVLLVGDSPYLDGDLLVITTGGDYTATPDHPVTVLD